MKSLTDKESVKGKSHLSSQNHKNTESRKRSSKIILRYFCLNTMQDRWWYISELFAVAELQLFFLWSWVTAVWNLIQILVFILISAIWCVSLLFSALQGSITKDENKKTASLSMITIKQLYKWIKSYLVCDFKGRLTLFCFLDVSPGG